MILCSKYFYERIPKIKRQLEKKGHILKMPNSYEEPFQEEEIKSRNKNQHAKWKGNMMRKDEENIKPQDAVLVLNFEKKGIPNYLGGATLLETYMAWRLGKKIFLYNPIPNCSFTDELIGMGPIIINGNLKKIK